jgi:zinc transporter 2
MRILRECLSVLMEGSPLNFDMEILKNDLLKVKGVSEVHDLHVWSLSVGKISLSCHLISDDPQNSLREAVTICKKKYKIKHSTIQVESSLDQIKHECDDHNLH